MSRLLQYDHYKVLGIPYGASRSTIKRAYREKVKFCHPDVNSSPKAAEAFNAVQEAHDTLMNQATRTDYDARIAYYRNSQRQTNPDRVCRKQKAGTDSDNQRATFSFAALHLVGILFASAIGINAISGILFLDWPLYTFVFSLPAMFVLPDAINGFKRAVRSWN
jgi:curved DNA-binding protein CbpA